MNYKEYNISFYGKQYKSKPLDDKIPKISRNLSLRRLTYNFLAYRVGVCGFTFAPAVLNGKRKTENFSEQQLFAIDVDDKISFKEVKQRADRYRLPVLFAYRTFLYTEEHEKFRVVFAMDRIITDAFTAQIITKMLMRIFHECDSHCSDPARMFFGGNKGLLYFSEDGREFSFNDIVIALNSYIFDKYDESHYTEKIHQFYNSVSVETNRKSPVFSIENGNLIIEKSRYIQAKKVKRTCSGSKTGRRRNTNVDFKTLKERCKL